METKEIIERIYALNTEVQELLAKESEQYLKATEARDNKITIKRNGEDVEATEGEMWEEIRVTGANGEAGKYMKQKYSEVFAKYLKLRRFVKQKTKNCTTSFRNIVDFHFDKWGLPIT